MERAGNGRSGECAGVGVALVMRGREEAEKMVVWASVGPRRRVSAMKRESYASPVVDLSTHPRWCSFSPALKDRKERRPKILCGLCVGSSMRRAAAAEICFIATLVLILCK